MQQHNADSAVDVTYDARFERGKGQIEAKLKKQDGEWKLVTFRVNSPIFQQDLATAECPKCGAPHATNARFCPSCGTSLVQPVDKAAEIAEVPPADK